MKSILNSSLEMSQQSRSSLDPTLVISKLSDKVKSQAQRLRTLNKYKHICEQRVLELCPSHPIPVEEIHLGTFCQSEPEGTQEKYQQLLSEKVAIEQGFRNEMAINEQQRSYIEVLSQKYNELQRATQSVQECKENLKAPDKLHSKVIEKVTDELKKKNEEIAKLQAELSSFAEHFKQAEEALNLADEEVTKLEEEKSALLDYVDEHSRIEAELQDQLTALGTREETDSRPPQTGDQQDCGTQIEELKNLLVKKDEYAANLLEELQSARDKKESLQINVSTLADTLRETQAELDTYTQNSQEIEELTLKLESSQTKSDHLKSNYETELKPFSDTEGEENLQELHRKLSSEQCLLALAQQQVTSLKGELRDSEDAQEELRGTLFSLQKDLESISEHNSELLLDLGRAQSAQSDQNECISELAGYKSSLTSLLSSFTELLSPLESLFSVRLPSAISLDNIANVLKVFLSELKTQLESSSHENSKLTQQLEFLKQREKTLTGQLNFLTQEARQTKNSFTRSVKGFRSQMESLSQENNELYEKYLSAKKGLAELRGEVEEKEILLSAKHSATQNLEAKISLLQKEILEKSHSLSTLASALPLPLQRVFSQIVRIQVELKQTERQQFYFSTQLARLPEAQHKEIASLRTEISKCEGQVLAYSARLSSLEEEFSCEIGTQRPNTGARPQSSTPLI